jgi:hypothetical protein
MANTIEYRIVVRDDGTAVLKKSTDAATQSVDKLGKTAKTSSVGVGALGSSVASAKGLIVALAGAAAAAASGGGILALTKGAANAGDEVYKMAQRTGLAIPEVQDLAYAFESNGSSASAMESGVRSLSLKIADAVSGNKDAIASFASLGISVDDINPKTHTLNESFRLVVDSLTKYADDANKTSVGNDILGRSFSEMRPAIQGGTKDIDAAAAEGQALGRIFSAEVVQAAHDVNNSFDRLGGAIKGVANTIGAEFFPLVKDIIDRTTEWISKNRELIATKVKEFIDAAVSAAKILGPIILKSADAVLQLAKGLGSVNPELLKFAAGTAAVVGGTKLTTDAVKELVSFTGNLGTTLTSAAAGLKAIGSSALIAKTGLGSLAASGFLAVASAGALVVNELRELNSELGELASQSSRYLASVQALNPELRGLTMTQAALQQAIAANDAEMAKQKDRLDAASKATRNQSQAASEAKAEIARLEAEHKRLSSALEKANKDLQSYGKTQQGSKTLTVAVTDATLSSGDALERIAPPLKNAGQEAQQTAEKLAQLSKSAADSAVALVATVAAQGDAAATQKAYSDAITAVVDSYNAQVEAIDASTASVKVKEKEKAAAAKEASDKIVTAGTAVVKSEKDQAAAIAQLDAAIKQSNLTLLSDQIQQVTEDWDRLSSTQRESELPEVLALTEEKYALLTQAAQDAAQAQKDQGVTAAEAARIDANLALTTEHLANEKEREEDAWRKAASGAEVYVTAARAVEDELKRITGDLSNLAASVLTGQTGWDDAGKAVAGMFLHGFQGVLASQLEPIIGDVLKGLYRSSGLSSIVSGFGSWFGSLFGDTASAGLQQAVSGIGTNSGILSAAIASGGQVGTAATTGFAATLTAAAPYAAAAVAAAGVLYGVVTTSKMGPEAKAAIITALAGPLAGGLLYAFGVLDNPDMRKRIAQHVEKTIQTALSQDADFRGAIEAGLAPLGYELNAALAKSLSNASRSNDLLRRQAEILGEKYGADFMAGFSPAFTESINKHGASSTSVPASDWIRAFFGDADAATQAYADELAKSLASVEVAQMGLTGADAITYTENIAAGFINYAQSVGMTEEELIQFLETSNQAAGMSTKFFATLDQLNGAMIENGVSLSDVNAQISKFTGIDLAGAGNLVDLFIASGESAETFVKQLEKIAQTDPGLKQILDSLDPPLIDALHDAEDATMDVAKAFGLLSGTANASLSDVVADFQRFAGQITQAGEDATVELSSMGESLNRQLQQGLSGMSQTAIEDGQVTIDEVSAIFAQLGEISKIPADQLSQSTKDSMQELMDFLMQATNLTADELKAAVDAFNAGQPQPLPPPDPGTAAGYAKVAEDATTAAAATTDATAAAETLGPAVSASTDEFAALAKAAGMSSDQVRAAIQPIIGTEDDGQSLTATAKSLADITRYLPEEMVPSFEQSFTDANLAVSSTFTKVGELQSALTTLAGNYDITITTHYVTDGSPPETGGGSSGGDTGGGSGGGDTGHAAGHFVVPGPAWRPYPTVLHGGERVLSVEERRVYEGRSAPPASSSSGRDVAGEVVDRLTQGGRLHLFVASEVDAQKLGRSMLLSNVDELIRSGAITGAALKRNPARPS